MSRVWHGSVAGVVWPNKDPPVAGLAVEVWWPGAAGAARLAPRLDDVGLAFDAFVALRDVPAWAIAGPEMLVLTRDGETLRYFAEFAALRGVALRLAVVAPDRAADAAAGPAFTHLLLFRVEDDAATRIAARPVNARPRLPSSGSLARPLPAPAAANAATNAATNVTANATTSANASASASANASASASANASASASANASASASANTSARPIAAASAAASVAASAAASAAPAATSAQLPPENVKKTVQQTVMGALRLRGVRSSNPSFKKHYFAVVSLVELALQKTPASLVSVDWIHDKVEAILSIVD